MGDDSSGGGAGSTAATGNWRHVKFALSPEPTPVLVSTGVAVVIDLIVVFVAVQQALLAAGHPAVGLTHAVLPAVFGGLFAFLGSVGGTARSGLTRALGLSLVTIPLTLIAIAVRDTPVLCGLALAAATAGAGFLAWHGEPWATLGSLLLYMFFLPLAFAAGRDVPVKYLLIGFGVMTICTVALRGLAALVPHHRAPPRVASTDEKKHHDFQLLGGEELSRLHRTTLRSAIGLGLGAFAMSMTRDHNAVWVLMTLIALVPPAVPLTIDKVLQRSVGTLVGMVVLTVIDVVVPPGVGRLLLILLGVGLLVAYLRRSYTVAVIGVSMAAVLGYAQVAAPLGEALLWRGFDTLVGIVIACILTILIPVGTRPKPVWAQGNT